MSQEVARLLLDEMLAPFIAQELVRHSRDVIALVADPELRAMSDAEVYAWAGERGRWVVTENVKDFRPLVGTGAGPGVLLLSSRRFSRSRRNPGPLVDALDHWFDLAAASPRPGEDWLVLDAPRSA